jgi:cell wall-associated NlpC family hydrolase
MNQVGVPYRYGGNSPASGFDCSGLVNYVYKESAGISLPRSVKEIRALSVPEPGRDALQSGDIVIFATGFSRKPDHAGIYVGKNRFVHAPSHGGKVRIDKLDDAYWNKHYLTAKRPLAR